MALLSEGNGIEAQSIADVEQLEGFVGKFRKVVGDGVSHLGFGTVAVPDDQFVEEGVGFVVEVSHLVRPNVRGDARVIDGGSDGASGTVELGAESAFDGFDGLVGEVGDPGDDFVVIVQAAGEVDGWVGFGVHDHVGVSVAGRGRA